MPPVGLRLLPAKLPIGLVRRTPREHRLCEHVVEDLVANAASLLDRTHDPALAYLNEATSPVDLEMRQREVDRGRFRRSTRLG